MTSLMTIPEIKNYPSTFTAERFRGAKINNNKPFGYGMRRSAKNTIVYIKGNIMSLVAVVIENSGEVITPTEAIALLKMEQNKDKFFDINALSFENSCFNAIAFIRF